METKEPERQRYDYLSDSDPLNPVTTLVRDFLC
jgi:hypothetical protein